MREYGKRAVRLGRAPVDAENKNPAQDVLIKANRIVFARVSAMTRIKLLAEWMDPSSWRAFSINMGRQRRRPPPGKLKVDALTLTFMGRAPVSYRQEFPFRSSQPMLIAVSCEPGDFVIGLKNQ